VPAADPAPVGGVGIAVSSVATVSDARDTLQSKTAAQVIAETRSTFLSLGISDESVSRLVENRNYTPADLLIMARALKRLNAENTTAFVDHVAGAGSRNVAFYHRRRAQIIAERSKELGGIVCRDHGNTADEVRRRPGVCNDWRGDADGCRRDRTARVENRSHHQPLAIKNPAVVGGVQ
jgi:hypothetical protein